MNGFKKYIPSFKKSKPEESVKKETQAEARSTNERLATEVLDLKFQALMRKVVDQEIIIRRLLDLVVMDIEHKAYDKFLLPRIHAIKNLLDKK